MVQLNTGFTLFLSLLVEAIPFLLIGVAFSSLLLFFVDDRQLVGVLPKNPLLGALVGSLIGILFPVCECGNVPVARRLIVQGAPTAVSIGFLLAAPTINPVVFWATWVAFRGQPEIVFMRVGFTLLIATAIGWVFSRQSDIGPFLQEPVERSRFRARDPAQSPIVKSAAAVVQPDLLQGGTFLAGQSGESFRLDAPVAQRLVANPVLEQSIASKFELALENMVRELRELGAVLVFGSAVAATVQVAIPRETILGLGQGIVSSILAMMILAAVVSICSTVDSFFALSFAATFTSGSLVAFLIFGPMIDLKNIGLLLTVFKGRAVFYLFGLAALMSFAVALFVNLYIG
ncbi:Predicted permease superfamily [Synechococcus sp. PCC 7335]|uniref:permease n=1 Tax=Synechococcus sp. (strain ATCC 29403 / PCC 7335) TaxID=91464 RepID=UPI00017EB83B|nr:permease [Synechococcus sp. PCC 7335]EDX85600.1 Predicted permease superfamily [Synechococcus sp. PCC 7335]